MDLLARFVLSPHSRCSPVFRQCPPAPVFDFSDNRAAKSAQRAATAGRAFQPPGRALLDQALNSRNHCFPDNSRSLVKNSSSGGGGSSNGSSSRNGNKKTTRNASKMGVLASRANTLPPIWILGRFYSGEQWKEFYEDYVSRIWCTYRRGFANLGQRSNYRSDSGWGCMIRSGQMMLAEALLRHTIGRAWRLVDEKGSISTQHRPVLRMFLDHAASGACPFSIHQLVKRGEEKYGKSPGDWYGPELISQVIADVMNGSLGEPGMGKAMGVVMHVARGSVVYRDEIDKACFASEQGSHSLNAAKSGGPCQNPWKGNALYLVVPVRLGLDNIDADYFSEIFEILKFPQSTGIIGGRPGHSLYFVGAVDANVRGGVTAKVSKSSNSSGSSTTGKRNHSPQLIYLDPHYEQATCRLSGGFPDLQQLRTYHQPHPLAINVQSIDPGLAFGFYCRSPGDLDDLWSRLVAIREKGLGQPTFHLASSAPATSSLERYNLAASLLNSSFNSNDSENSAAGTQLGNASDKQGAVGPRNDQNQRNLSHAELDDEWELL